MRIRGLGWRLFLATALAGPFGDGAPRAAEAPPAPPPTQAESAADLLASVRRLTDELVKNPGTVVAEIGDRSISRGDVGDAMRGLPGIESGSTLDVIYHKAVEGLMAQQAMVIRAKAMGVDKDPDVQRRIAAATDAVLANEYLRRTITPMITDQALHEAYDREFANKPGAEEVQVRVIVTNTEREAADVLSQLAKGADFASLAKTASKDGSAPNGGELGFIRQDQVPPAIGGVIFALSPGQVTPFPVRVAPNAWFIVKAEGRRQQGTPSFETVRGHLTQQLARADAPAAIQKAVAGLPAHDYGMTGKPVPPVR